MPCEELSRKYRTTMQGNANGSRIMKKESEAGMRAGRNLNTGESEIYLSAYEAEQMKEMVRGACLPLRRVFNKLLRDI